MTDVVKRLNAAARRLHFRPSECRPAMADAATEILALRAQVAELTRERDEAREDERKAVVAWLQAEHRRIRNFASALSNAEELAQAIAAGEHRP